MDQQDQFLSRIVSIFQDYITVTDEEGRIRYVNQAAISFLGYPEEELLGKHVSVLYPLEDRGQLEKMKEEKDRKGVATSRAACGARQGSASLLK